MGHFVVVVDRFVPFSLAQAHTFIVDGMCDCAYNIVSFSAYEGENEVLLEPDVTIRVK